MRVAAYCKVKLEKGIIVSGKWIDGKKFQFTVRGPTRLVLPIGANYLETTVILNGRKRMGLFVKKVTKSEALGLILDDAMEGGINPQKEIQTIALSQGDLYYVRIIIEGRLLYQFIALKLYIDTIWELLTKSAIQLLPA